MSHGGKRPGAGRKSDSEVARLRALTREVATEAKWRGILIRLVEKAEAGNLRAVELLARYSFGATPEVLAKSTESGEDAAPGIAVTPAPPSADS